MYSEFYCFSDIQAVPFTWSERFVICFIVSLIIQAVLYMECGGSS